MDIRVETVPPIPALACRHNGANGDIDEAFERLQSIVEPSGLSTSDLLAVYYSEDDTAPENQKSDACVVLPIGSNASLGGLNRLDVPGGKFAIGRYVGPYSGLPEAWEYLSDQATGAQGLQLDGRPCMERFVTISEDPTQHVTDLYLPVL